MQESYLTHYREQTLTSPNATRSATPVSSVGASADKIATDDALLRQYSAALVDIRAMETNTLRLWRQIIGMMMPDTDEEDLQAEGWHLSLVSWLALTLISDALREVLSGLSSFIEPVSSKIIVILTDRCIVNLSPVKSVLSQFKMSSKRPPTEASYFVSSILRPVKQFFAIGTTDGPGGILKDVYLKRFSTEVFNNVTQQ